MCIFTTFQLPFLELSCSWVRLTWGCQQTSLFDETSVGVIHRPPFVAEKACFSPTHEGSSCSDENLTTRWQHSSSQQMLKVFCLFLVPLNKYESRFFSSCSLRCQALRHIVFLSLCTGFFFPKINGEATSKKCFMAGAAVMPCSSWCRSIKYGLVSCKR